MLPPIEQALVGLVPSINSLPKELVDRANSLLRQSKAKAPNLKQDQEIGRIYACAHLACERLRQQLGLEISKPNAPCGPRIYKKLYTLFDQTLTDPATPRTPRHRDALKQPQSRGSAGTPTQQSWRPTSRTGGVLGDAAGEEETPSRRSEKRAPRPATHAQVETPASTRKRKSMSEVTGAGAEQTLQPPAQETERVAASEVPDFIPDMVKRLCVDFSLSGVEANITEGLQSVLGKRGFDDSTHPPSTKTASDKGVTTPSKTRNAPKPALLHGKGIITVARIPALLIVLTLYASMQGRSQSSEIDVAEYRELRAQGFQSVRQMEQGWMQGDEELMADVEGFMKAAVAESWLDGEWFAGLGAVVAKDTRAEDAVMEDVDAVDEVSEAREEIEAGGNDELDDGRPIAATPRSWKGNHAKTPLRRKEKHATMEASEETAAGLQAGLGTMFQDAVDWLSDDRRRDYRLWEKNIRIRMDRLEHSLAGGKRALAV